MLTADGLSPEDEQRREHKRTLVDATRRLAEAVALVDAGNADTDEVASLVATIDDLTKRIDDLPSYREQGLFAAPGFASKLAERSPISGVSNPLAPPFDLWQDGDIVRGRATYGAAYEGPPGLLHGGVVAAAFDEVLAVAQFASGLAGFTGTLTLRMRRPTPLFRPIDYEAGVDRTDGRKIHAWGRSTCDGELLVEGEAIFVSRGNGG